jgi:hypothetical protein
LPAAQPIETLAQADLKRRGHPLQGGARITEQLASCDRHGRQTDGLLLLISKGQAGSPYDAAGEDIGPVRDGIEERGFAAAIGTPETDHFAGPDLERDRSDHRSAIAGDQTRHPQQG